MIDYLIFDKKKKIRLIWSYIFKDMNFLIFRDFMKFFQIFSSLFGLNFYFILILENKNKFIIVR